MARGQRGGNREPRKPAPVSNPGSGKRTDGGPAQPIRVPTGGDYGEATALREQQQAAPLAAGSSTPSAIGGGAGMPDAFRATERPHQALGPRIPNRDAAAVPDPNMLMRILYARYPHPSLRRMLEAAQKRQR